ncbi:MAG: UDP-N-acetylmuramate--L-alanine ligase [Candidatus Margulisiibacteriota bacterium]
MTISKKKTIYFIGIGGAGMSAIAKILLEQGYKVSGSDLKETITTIRLKDLGAKLFYGHDPKNLRSADYVVVSSAISEDNPEYTHALQEKLPVLKRAEMLNEVMKSFPGRISVAGTHGKTTTTSMITRVLESANQKPTYIIGAEMADYGGSAGLGDGNYVVAESDESDGSFLHLEATIGVLTNIEPEHMDYYKRVDNLFGHFVTFMNAILSRKGYLVLNADDANLMSLVPQLSDTSSVIYYGIEAEASIRAQSIVHSPTGVHFNLLVNGEDMGEVLLSVKGVHNVYNALAAIAFGLREHLPLDLIKKGLMNFTGAKRRLQVIGQVNDIIVYDDYGHHPTEIRVTLEGVKQSLQRRTICIFQPHRYTRTRDLLESFPTAFGAADKVIITEIYSANEKKISGISGKVIVDKMKKLYPQVDVCFISKKSDIASKLAPTLKQGDVVITMGAGDIYTVAKELYVQLKEASLDLTPAA